MKDSDGNRPGKPLKVEFDALKHESNRFATALQNAKQASRELSEQLPAAQRTISDISDDVEKYSRHIQPTVDRMKQKAKKLTKIWVHLLVQMLKMTKGLRKFKEILFFCEYSLFKNDLAIFMVY